MKSYKTTGIVLHTLKYGDSSLIVYMFTLEHGRLTYMVQGVRSSRGRGNKGALLQPMFMLEYEGFEPRHGEMHRMKDIRSVMPMTSIPFDIRKSTVALFMAETLYRLIRESEANAPLYNFIHECVETLDEMSSGISNFHLWFLVQLSYYLGFYPSNEYRIGSIFDIKEGCFSIIKPTHDMIFSEQSSRILFEMMRCERSDLSTIELSRGSRGGFLNSLVDYFGYHFDSIHSIRSISILREVF